MERKVLSDPGRMALALVRTKTEQKGEMEGRRINFPAPSWYQRGLWQLCVSREVKARPGTVTAEVSITQKVKFK